MEISEVELTAKIDAATTKATESLAKTHKTDTEALSKTHTEKLAEAEKVHTAALEGFKEFDVFKKSHELVEKSKADLEAMTGKHGEATEALKKFEGTAESLVATRKSLMDALQDEKKSLIPENLNDAQAVDHMMKNFKLLFGTDVKFQSKEDQGGGSGGGNEGKFGPNGEYKSKMEWASKDHKSYIAAHKNPQGTF